MSNKKSIYAAVLGLVIIGAFAFVLHSGKDKNTNTTSNSSIDEPTQVAASASDASAIEAPADTAPSYQDYSEANLASAQNQRVLFFHAPWCFQCRELDQDLKDEGAPAGYTVFKVDYDSNESLRQKYGITFRTAFLKIDASGNAIGKEYIAFDEPSIAAVKRDFLTQ